MIIQPSLANQDAYPPPRLIKAVPNHSQLALMNAVESEIIEDTVILEEIQPFVTNQDAHPPIQSIQAVPIRPQVMPEGSLTNQSATIQQFLPNQSAHSPSHCIKAVPSQSRSEMSALESTADTVMLQESLANPSVRIQPSIANHCAHPPSQCTKAIPSQSRSAKNLVESTADTVILQGSLANQSATKMTFLTNPSARMQQTPNNKSREDQQQLSYQSRALLTDPRPGLAAVSMPSIASGPQPSLKTNLNTVFTAAPASQKNEFSEFKELMLADHICPQSANDSCQIPIPGSKRGEFDRSANDALSGAFKTVSQINSQRSQDFNLSKAMASTQPERKRGLSSKDELKALFSKRPAPDSTCDQHPEETPLPKLNNLQASQKTCKLSYSKVDIKSAMLANLDEDSDEDIFLFDEPKASPNNPAAAKTSKPKRKSMDDDNSDEDFFGFNEIFPTTGSSSKKQARMSTQIDARKAAPAFDNQLCAIEGM